MDKFTPMMLDIYACWYSINSIVESQHNTFKFIADSMMPHDWAIINIIVSNLYIIYSKLRPLRDRYAEMVLSIPCSKPKGINVMPFVTVNGNMEESTDDQIFDCRMKEAKDWARRILTLVKNVPIIMNDVSRDDNKMSDLWATLQDGHNDRVKNFEEAMTILFGLSKVQIEEFHDKNFSENDTNKRQVDEMIVKSNSMLKSLREIKIHVKLGKRTLSATTATGLD